MSDEPAVQVISQNTARNMAEVCIGGHTYHRAIDQKKPTRPKKKGPRADKEKK